MQPSSLLRLCLVAASSLVIAASSHVSSSFAEAASPPDPQEAARRVDELLLQEVHGGDASGLAPIAGDQTFLRRVTLDIAGRNPTPDEIAVFALDATPDRRAAAIAWLLNDSAYGENWAAYWRDAIMYRRSEDRALLAAPILESYLAGQLSANRPWSEIVAGLITATGDVREEGATGLIMAQGGKPEETVAEISRLFLGIQLQCAQCHDHPYDRWKREQFHELAAFFPRVAVRPVRDGERRSFEVAVSDRQFGFFGNNNNRFRGTPEHFMSDLEDPQARGTRMQPVFFLTGEKLSFGAPDVRRRGQLAEWITSPENPWFAKALVNRIWAELVGEGFYEPVDDIGPDRTPSAPETLEALSAAFTESGYDMKWLFRTIMATEAYQRESRPRRGPEEAPFTANVAQRLRADQLYNNVRAALELPEPRAAGRGPYGAMFSPRNAFNQVFGYDPSDRREEVAGSIPQALVLMNSPQLAAMMTARPGAVLGRLLREIPGDRELIAELYLRVLARDPTPQELETCLAYRRHAPSRAEAMEDVLWSLVNSTEFLYRG